MGDNNAGEKKNVYIALVCKLHWQVLWVVVGICINLDMFHDVTSGHFIHQVTQHVKTVLLTQIMLMVTAMNWHASNDNRLTFQSLTKKKKKETLINIYLCSRFITSWEWHSLWEKCMNYNCQQESTNMVLTAATRHISHVNAHRWEHSELKLLTHLSTHI